MGKLYMISSALMAALFIVSASLQFNDQGWYPWILLYASAAYVNLISCWSGFELKGADFISKAAHCQATFSLSGVMLDDNFGGIAGLWSLDMREKLVREKLGCVLVIVSMILQSSAIQLFQQNASRRMNMQVTPSIQNGMAILAGISYGLSFIFLKSHQQEMKL